MHDDDSGGLGGGLLDVSETRLRDLRNPAMIEPTVLDMALDRYLNALDDTEPSSAGFNSRI